MQDKLFDLRIIFRIHSYFSWTSLMPFKFVTGYSLKPQRLAYKSNY